MVDIMLMMCLMSLLLFLLVFLHDFCFIASRGALWELTEENLASEVVVLLVTAVPLKEQIDQFENLFLLEVAQMLAHAVQSRARGRRFFVQRHNHLDVGLDVQAHASHSSLEQQLCQEVLTQTGVLHHVVVLKWAH